MEPNITIQFRYLLFCMMFCGSTYRNPEKYHSTNFKNVKYDNEAVVIIKDILESNASFKSKQIYFILILCNLVNKMKNEHLPILNFQGELCEKGKKFEED